ncbi:MAG: cytidylate kinase-like family protein [Clostridiales bacterium]|jgi:cytidylate kinase|nr:cytidylate kinase-like family protein [Clostridiales bacterium]
MKNLVITIGREFGSGGHEVGKRLAKKLGISLYDEKLIELAAEKTGFNKEYVKENDEKTPKFSAIGLRTAFAPEFYQLTNLDNIQIEQYNIVKEIAQKESCIIVGRGSDYALRDIGSINIFLHAPLTDRVNRKLALEKGDETLSYGDMENKVQQVDKQHRKYYEYYSDKKWGNSQSYDFCINTSALGIDGTVDLIASFVKDYGKTSIMPD